MECNKDEALRAKQIAESRMQIGDFVGALKFATRAQKLFPEVENIVHILTVCEVHCAAQKKLSGSEMDWYGILQTEQLADEATIKKQFRKLALLLHPDKNKFSGAEAAFKLIGEANRLLSDKEKRKLYDVKYRAFTRTASSRPPYYNSNGSVFAPKHDVKARNHQNYPQPTSWNSYQQAAQQTFWTTCSHCKTRYEYYRTVLNATLRCHQCSRPFVAREMGFQHGPPEYKWTSDQKEYSNFEFMAKCTHGVDGHCKGGKGEDGNVAAGMAKVDVRTSKPASSKARESYSSTHIGSKRNRESVPDPRESFKTENGNGVKGANVQGSGIDPSGPKAEAQSRRSSRQKKDVSYSETSCDDDNLESPKRHRRNGSSSTITMGKREEPAGGGLSKHNHSASSVAGLGGERGEKSNKANGMPEEILLQKKSKIEQSHVQREEPTKSSVDDTNSKADHYPPFNSAVPSLPDIINCPDPDFSDFEKDRVDNCFAKDQFWAIYDPSDSMPRYYARVKKVLSPGFKLLVIWLEADPDDEGEIDWQDAELPVGCGKFRLGDTQEIEDHAMFSHQMHNIKGIGRRRYAIYPSKGETWAIFKDWDINWSSNPEKHCKYEYEFVEILSDFTENIGIEVVYLGKLEGFVSLFQQTERNGLSLFCVPPNELYRFSHRVPSFKMTGDERDGVPCGSFELDPAGLPVDLFGVGNAGDGDIGDEMLDAGVKSSGYKSSEQKVENVTRNESDHDAKVNRSNDVKRASPILRRSPRGSNRKDMNNCQVNGSQYVTRENGSKDMGCVDFSQPDGSDEPSNGGKMHKTDDVQKASSVPRRSPRGLKGRSMENGRVNESQHMTREDGSKYVGCKDFSQLEGIASEDQAGERVKTPKKHEKNGCGREGSDVQRSPRDLSKKKAQVDANQCMTGKASGEHSNADKKLKDSRFSESFGGVCGPFAEDCRVPKASRFMVKSEEIFERGQIWALYGDKDRTPDTYAQIKKIDFAPDIRLHVAFLEPCSLPKGITGMVACGAFKVKNAKTRVVSISNFSHQLRVEPRKDNRYEIYPRKGEIWALYKNQHRGSTCSNQVRGGCHIVEVLEDDDENSKVVVLDRHNDSRPIYKTPRIQRSKKVIIDIPRVDAYRFSHQIPAFKHTEDGETHLKGCWELDPSSIPGFVINLD